MNAPGMSLFRPVAKELTSQVLAVDLCASNRHRPKLRADNTHRDGHAPHQTQGHHAPRDQPAPHPAYLGQQRSEPDVGQR